MVGEIDARRGSESEPLAYLETMDPTPDAASVAKLRGATVLLFRML